MDHVPASRNDRYISQRVKPKSKDLFRNRPDRPQLEVLLIYRTEHDAGTGSRFHVKPAITIDDLAGLQRLQTDSKDAWAQIYTIRHERSWTTLNISYELFKHLLSVQNVYHHFWESMLTFGRKSSENEYAFPALRSRVVASEMNNHDKIFFSAGNRQRLKNFEDYVTDMQVIMHTMIDTISGIGKSCQQYCELTCKDRQPDCCKHVIEEFEASATQAAMYLERAQVLKARVQSTSQLLADLLAYDQARALTELVQASQVESQGIMELNKRSVDDAAAVKMLTVIGLIFLPSTIVANFFSTVFVNINDQDDLHVSHDVWYMAAVNKPPKSANDSDSGSELVEHEPLQAEQLPKPGQQGHLRPQFQRQTSSHSPSINAELVDGKSNFTPTLQKLRQDVRAAYTPCHFHENVPGWKFLPESSLAQLINLDTVQAVLEEEAIVVDKHQAQQIARKIVHDAPHLYAILVVLGKETSITGLLDEQITDDDLPFQLEDSSSNSQSPGYTTRYGREVVALRSWDSESLKSLELKQYRILTPIFQEDGDHELFKFQSPPFIKWMPRSVGQGSFSEVFQARIHPDHHTFAGRLGVDAAGPLVAVKRLYRTENSYFETERDNLRLLNSSAGHIHLVTMLCIYKMWDTYHFVFPWANGTLRSYWRKNPFPTVEHRLMLWSLKQMAGIAGGLACLHDFTTSDRDGQNLFGRHGDLKPENILWFENYAGYDDPDGLLQITDLGLSRIHTRASRSNDNPAGVISPSTYSPPDARRNLNISRAWDQWGLGCMFMEFAIWLLCGYDAIEDFAAARGEDDPDPNVNTDLFFTTDNSGIRPSVLRWVDELHAHQNCTRMIHDLLDMIMSGMIVIDTRKRITSSQVRDRLEQMLRTAENDPGYLTDPVPWDLPTSLPRPSPRPSFLLQVPSPSWHWSSRLLNRTDRNRTWPLASVLDDGC
ncbi:hypothetical protein FE257_010086 [Aspergillus nanangensis]|uniref:Protein kinase domain-containing protein n=1 Tax=Aspergillus nanangensis TaxID=2582783 RepID=A0AAD4CKN4_ASPNN|nr:hypothetical protein FE257_010086 [Aspergillus nanangensis]